jgi:hypothetical protein
MKQYPTAPRSPGATFHTGRGLLALAAALLAAACGGGPDGGGQPVPVPNRAPVADAGTAQSVREGASVMLDGRRSADPDGDPVRYAWTLTAGPPGSAAVLITPNAAAPSFTADAAGDYVASLVVHDGRVASAEATVRVTASASQARPVADAGADQNVVTGATVRLDGRASSDADGDALTFRWTWRSRPAASTAALAAADTAVARFSADRPGSYVAALVVSDGRQDSMVSTTTVQVSAAALAAQVSPEAADFGSVPVGSATLRVFALRNTGNGTLTFGPGQPRTDGGAWSLAGRSCAGTLAPGASCTVTVAFRPPSVGAYNGALHFDFVELAAGQGAPRAALQGTGAGGVALSAAVTPISADFGTVPVGSTAARVFTLTNTGSGALSFMDGYPTTEGGVWSLGGRSCLGTLAAGASCTVTVVFTPRSASASSGTVAFYFNELPVGQGNPLATVSGLGEGGPALGATVTPSGFDFGLVPVGMVAPRVFTVTNTGEGLLTFAAGSPSTDGGGWSLGGRSCAGSLPAGASCTITVNFTPRSAQPYTGWLQVDFNELPTGEAGRRSQLIGSGG